MGHAEIEALAYSSDSGGTVTTVDIPGALTNHWDLAVSGADGRCSTLVLVKFVAFADWSRDPGATPASRSRFCCPQDGLTLPAALG